MTAKKFGFVFKNVGLDSLEFGDYKPQVLENTWMLHGRIRCRMHQLPHALQCESSTRGFSIERQQCKLQGSESGAVGKALRKWRREDAADFAKKGRTGVDLCSAAHMQLCSCPPYRANAISFPYPG